jgi:hypothetical protein
MKIVGWCLTLSLCVTLIPAAHGQMATIATYKHGQITFTQGGKEATWRLVAGTIDTLAGTWMVNLTYAPDSKAEGVGRSLMLTVTRLPADLGGTTDVDRLMVERGPAGDATYHTPVAQCKLTIAQLTLAAVEGSGTCTGTFERGPAITKFTFAARP